MTPGARIAAAIEILDQMAMGLAAEPAISRWSRNSRFAGSKDRAAVRDHVFEVLRCKRSAAHLGGNVDGRSLMIGLMRHLDQDIDALFHGEGHAPAPLTSAEKGFVAGSAPREITMNLPDWLIPEFDRSLPETADEIAELLQSRAPITLRVNDSVASVSQVVSELAELGVETVPNAISPQALNVKAGERRIRASAPYENGAIEFQDAASQAVVNGLPQATRVLDYCAGGGGKSLGLAARADTQVFAHDINPLRMKDLAQRATRAGVEVTEVPTEGLENHAPFDLVLCDAPCSGSGAWRRAPEGKWALTAARLAEIQEIQDDILTRAAALTAQDGTLVYVTCSVLTCENEDRVAAFLTRHSEWQQDHTQRFDVCNQADGFFVAHLTRQ